MSKKVYWFIPFLVIAIYINSVFNGFVLDDPSQVASNVNVTQFKISDIFFGSSFGVGGGTQGTYYKPLMSTSYAVLYKVFGSEAWSFHLLQLWVHAVNSILVFYIFRRLFGGGILKRVQDDEGKRGDWLSLFLALIFAVHPFNSEAVLYVSDLQDVLFFCFGALGFLAATKVNLKAKDIALAGIFMALSLLSKETGVVFLVVTVLYRFVFYFKKKQREQFFWLLATFATVFMLYAGLRMIAVGVPSYKDSPYPIMRLTFWQRLVNVPEEVFYYLRNFFWPYDFAMAQHWVVTKVDWRYFGLPLLVDALFVGVMGLVWVIGGSSRRRLYGFFLAWFGVGLGIHLNLIPLDVTVADRWFYFPALGLLGIVGLFLSSLRGASRRSNLFLRLPRFARNDYIWVVLAIVIVAVLSMRTFVRTFDWRNGLTLDQRDIKYSRDSFPLENNYAFELINVGRWDEALVHAKRSTQLGPWWWLNFNNLGIIYRHLGKFDLAIESFRKGAENTNVFVSPHENLAETALNFREPKEAIAAVDWSLGKVGPTGRLLFLKALAHYKLGEIQEASADAKRSAELGEEKGKLLYQGLVNGQTIQVVPTQY